MLELLADPLQIRAKRLAKLGGNTASANNTSTPTTPQPTSDTAKPTVESEKATSQPPANPFSQVLMNPEETSKKVSPQIKITPRPASPAKRERDGSERPRIRQEKPAESFEVWQDRHLRSIFRVTLEPEGTKDAHGHRLLFLASTRSELDESGISPPLLNVEVLEGAITEAASQAPGGKPFEYLLACFKRVSKVIRGLKAGADDAKLGLLREARRLCMSYCVFAVTMPEMFGENVPTSNPLVDHLLADPECDTGICSDFLQEASNRFEEDDSIKDAIVGAAEELSRQLAGKTMVDDYQFYLRGLRNLMRFPKVVDAITESPSWIPWGVDAPNIEKSTLLGPFFRLSPIQTEVAQSYFSAPRTRDRGFIANAQNASRLTLRTHQQELFDLANAIVKSGPVSRERILSWFALCVNKNHKKRAMRVNPKEVSSDGFMINVTNILDQLCEPFMDATFSKIDRIHPEYLRRSPRVDIQEETKINADQKAADEFYSHPTDGTNNFISELFFLTVAAHHYGPEAAQSKQNDMRKNLKRSEQELEQFEKERVKYTVSCRLLS